MRCSDRLGDASGTVAHRVLSKRGMGPRAESGRYHAIHCLDGTEGSRVVCLCFLGSAAAEWPESALYDANRHLASDYVSWLTACARYGRGMSRHPLVYISEPWGWGRRCAEPQRASDMEPCVMNLPLFCLYIDFFCSFCFLSLVVKHNQARGSSVAASFEASFVGSESGSVLTHGIGPTWPPSLCLR